MCTRLALAAFVAALFSGSSATAQQPSPPKPEAELKKTQEQLEKLLKELKELQDKEASKSKPKVANVPPLTPPPPTPPLPAPPGAQARPMVAWAALPAGGADKTAALKELLQSKDPKTAALARELLEHLLKSAPKPEPDGRAHTLSLELVPSTKSGVFEYKLAPPASTEPKTVERRVVVVGDKGPEGKPIEARFTVAGEKTTAGGSSMLKLSADGKTAAVVSADGTVTIYDVASGKEMMKFGGKK